ncbi:prefoldin subunit 5-like isoform X1 [Branchiostoma floridae x Branchiostoma belcheri]
MEWGGGGLKKKYDFVSDSLLFLTQKLLSKRHETEMFAGSLQSLKAAQQKFVESQQNLETLVPNNEGKEILVPLTSSMYVPGHLSDVKCVMVDIGTGYYVEKTTDEAKAYFKRKVEFCTQQMEKIQPLLQDRATKKQAVIDVMRDKMIQMQMMQMQQAGQASRA